MKKNEGIKNIEDMDLNKLPGPLFKLVGQYKNETQSLRKVLRLVDIFEWVIKWHTTLIMSDLLREKEIISPEIKVLLSEGLRTPALGLWMKFYRNILEIIKEPLYDWKKNDQLHPEHLQYFLHLLLYK